MTNEEMLGRMSALLELNEKVAEESMKAQSQISEINTRLMAATRDIEDLRGIVYDLRKLLKESKKTDWMTTGQVATRLSLHEKTIRRMFLEGRLPGYRIGPREIRFDRQEIEAFMKNKNKTM